jgi:chromosome segregation ATPase
MLTKISLVIAIIACLAVGALNFTKIKDQITTLRTERDSEKSQKEVAQNDLRKTKADLTKTTAELKTTTENLTAMTAAKEKAETDAQEKIKLAAQLQENLKTTQKSLDDARAELASYQISG